MMLSNMKHRLIYAMASLGFLGDTLTVQASALQMTLRRGMGGGAERSDAEITRPANRPQMGPEPARNLTPEEQAEVWAAELRVGGSNGKDLYLEDRLIDLNLQDYALLRLIPRPLGGGAKKNSARQSGS